MGGDGATGERVDAECVKLAAYITKEPSTPVPRHGRKGVPSYGHAQVAGGHVDQKEVDWPLPEGPVAAQHADYRDVADRRDRTYERNGTHFKYYG